MPACTDFSRSKNSHLYFLVIQPLLILGFPHGGPFPAGHPAAPGPPPPGGIHHRMPGALGAPPGALTGFPPTAAVSQSLPVKPGNDIFSELQQVQYKSQKNDRIVRKSKKSKKFDTSALCAEYDRLS